MFFIGNKFVSILSSLNIAGKNITKYLCHNEERVESHAHDKPNGGKAIEIFAQW